MKKFILTAVAAGALAAAGAASAQNLGDVLANILNDSAYGQQNSNRVYTDRYGRQVYRDAYGREIVAQGSPIVGYDRWGRAVYGQGGGMFPGIPRDGSSPADLDGDGVPNELDREPTNGRQW